MKVTPRRPRSDSVAAALLATQNALEPPIEPPECVTLRPEDRAFWDRIMKSKARQNWTQVDLLAAASLARTFADVDALQRLVDTEGYVVGGKIHPAVREVSKLLRQAAMLASTIQVDAAATNGHKRDVSASATAERDAALFEDDLIPMPYQGTLL